MLLDRNFDDVDETTLNELVEAGATETVYLDFKRETYGSSDSDKKEILKDISSFANSLGGQLVIGIDEEDGAASKVTPITGMDIDQELLRLENIVRTGVEPKIIGLRMKRIQVQDGSVILINVPKSFNPPHRVIFKNSNRYYARNSSGTYELSLEELRMLFGQQRTIEERAIAFINERFLRIQANDGALLLPIEEGAIVMHLVPLSDFGSSRRHDITTLQKHSMHFHPLVGDGLSSRINLDGLVVPDVREKSEYTQVFRDGSVEAASASVIVKRKGKRFFPSQSLPETLIHSLTSFMKGLKAIDAAPPVALSFSFLGMSGVKMGTSAWDMSDPPDSYDRSELHLPPTIISDYLGEDGYERIISEQMDFLWNAYGLVRCNFFDEKGRWIRKQ